MIFPHSRNGVLKIGPEALIVLRSFEQHAPDSLEAGGLLLGRYVRGGYDIIVDCVTTPFPGDVRSRYGFERVDPRHQAAVDKAWSESNGTCNYLGDWHTHAEPNPRPSRVDLNNWLHLLADAQHDGSAQFFVIVGQAEVCAWEADQKTHAINKLALRDAPVNVA